MRTPAGRVAIGLGILATTVVVAGCGDGAAGIATTTSGDGLTVTTRDDGFNGTLIEPARPRPDLLLPTTSGERFDLSDRPDDEVTVLFFGYTHCPDVCPTTMADLSLAYDMLAPDVRDQVRVVFVTEDPLRDSPEVTREWLDRFDRDFTGLIGGNMFTAAALRELYLPETAHVQDPSGSSTNPGGGDDAHEEYGVEHAGAVYAWGPSGRSVVYTGGTSPEQYAQDFTALASG